MAETPTAQTASLEGIEGELLAAIAKAADLNALEEVRVGALGKKGRVSELMQTLGRMAPLERNILRLALWEFVNGVTPAEVAIDEAVRLAKRYSTDEAGSFVNGILGAVHRERESEGEDG